MIRNIVAVAQFEDQNDESVHWAIPIAKQLGAKLWLLHVRDPDPEFVGYEAGPQSVIDHVEKLQKDRKSRLEDLAEEAVAAGAIAATRIVQGPYVEKVLEESHRLSADLIVVESEPQGMFSRLLHGDSNRFLTQGASCPVVSIPKGTTLTKLEESLPVSEKAQASS